MTRGAVETDTKREEKQSHCAHTQGGRRSCDSGEGGGGNPAEEGGRERERKKKGVLRSSACIPKERVV